jgi:hypothetical protein
LLLLRFILLDLSDYVLIPWYHVAESSAIKIFSHPVAGRSGQADPNARSDSRETRTRSSCGHLVQARSETTGCAGKRRAMTSGTLFMHTEVHGVTITWASNENPAWHMHAEVRGWHLRAWDDGRWEIRRDRKIYARGKERVCADSMQRAAEVLYGLTKDL